MSDLVAGVVIGEIGTVRNIVLSRYSEKFFYLSTSDGKKRPYDIPTDAWDPCKPLYTRSTAKIKDDSFKIIIGIVSSGKLFALGAL